MKMFFIFLFCLISYSVIAQKESNIWYFGNGAGLDFNDNIPTSIAGALNTNEGCASVADSNGELLFYSDGLTVWNRNHDPMPNGTELLGHFSSTQAVIIVPKPNSSTIYYVFTTGAVENTSLGLRYSIVDMELNGGLGDITSVKNELLSNTVSEKLVATVHRNKRDIWIISHLLENNTFQAHLLTENGLDTYIVESSCGSILSGYPAGIGYMKISSDSYRLALAHGKLKKIELFDFNNFTGKVSNPVILKEDYPMGSPYGLEFSPSSRFLYTALNANESEIYQYDLLSDNIPASKVLIAKAHLTLTLQLGPDGKIYIGIPFTSFMSVIHEPDLLGMACNFQENDILIDGEFTLGLPPLVVKPHPNDTYEPPNIFSPNGDNKNDFFTLFIPNASTYSIKIVNRWGELVFESEDLLSAWDGKINDHDASEGTYFYILNYSTELSTEVNSLTGHVTLLR